MRICEISSNAYAWIWRNGIRKIHQQIHEISTSHLPTPKVIDLIYCILVLDSNTRHGRSIPIQQQLKPIEKYFDSSTLITQLCERNAQIDTPN